VYDQPSALHVGTGEFLTGVRRADQSSRHAGSSLSPIARTLELAEPRDLEILVRVVATGICHTDIGMRKPVFPVPQPIVLGHEGAGVVEKVGRAVSKVEVGDHVVMNYNSCGVCESCLEDEAPY
jgi:aryl-alcohol dehydrogenase